MNFDSLKDQVSNLTLYDIKAGVRKVQNAVMNYTEMEAKVREATNNEPWGASTTLMQEIANGTHSYQLLNEIMPMIYKRFTDKTAEEWRQIYKALQLLEFLIKNGSERVIDDARSHLSLLRMLRQFHFIDQNGKDQGINVRNRAQELAKLLNDVDSIRAERKKARANKNKYGGVEGGAGLGGGFSGGSSSRYGGFGSEDASFGGYSGGVYGDGGGFGGNTSSFQEGNGKRSDRFEEYDEYDEGAASSSGRRRADPSPSVSQTKREAKKPEPPQPKEPEQDLLFDDEPAPSTASNGKQPASTGLGSFGDLQSSGAAAADDDDFDDFQSATPAPSTVPSSSSFSSFAPPASTATPSLSTQFAAPKPVSATQAPNISDLVGYSSMTPTPSGSSVASPATATTSQTFPSLSSPLVQAQTGTQPRPTGFQAKQPNYFTSVPAPTTPSVSSPASTSGVSRPGLSSTSSTSSFATPGAKPAASKASGDVFGSLWSSASAGAGIQKTSTSKGPNLASMAQAKSSAGIWGTGPSSSPAQGTAPAQSPAPGQKPGGGLEDLLG